MRVSLDHNGLFGLSSGWEVGDYSIHHLSAAPALAIVTFRNGLDPKALTSAVVEAQIAEQAGLESRVRGGNAGQPHSFIMVSERVDGAQDTTMS